MATQPLLLPLLGGLWLLIALGAGNLFRAQAVTRLLTFSGLLAIVIGWASMTAKGLYLHHWYVLYALPGILLLCGQAFSASLLWGRIASVAAALAITFNLSVNLLLWNNSKENIRAVQEALTQSPAILGALFSDVDAYDKNTTLISQKSAAATADLEALILKAQTENLPLFINYTRRNLIAAQMPEVLNRLENPQEFALVAIFEGFDEPQFTHYLLRWTGRLH